MPILKIIPNLPHMCGFSEARINITYQSIKKYAQLKQNRALDILININIINLLSFSFDEQS
jgi:hypothetical protein